MIEIDFKRIAARGGSVTNAFEELCCQLVSRTRASGSKYERYHGAGGDGGVECKVIDAVGSATGWQMKYVFEIEALLKQAQKSFETALSVQQDLIRFVVCFPFDLTGKTARRGKSQTEKFDDWAQSAEATARAIGREVSIEKWTASDIRDIIISNDSSGGLRHYFFASTTLTQEWFEAHLASATHHAGPRYNQAISIETPLSQWFTAFEGGENWKIQIRQYLKICNTKTVSIEKLFDEKGRNPTLPGWPEQHYEISKNAISMARDCAQFADNLIDSPTEIGLNKLKILVSDLLTSFASIENALAVDLEATHGAGTSNSKRFRSKMAEYMVSFPAANLDAVRDAKSEWELFSDWLSSPSGFLAFRDIFVITGTAGAGKTHSICDIAQRRMSGGAYTCIIFGDQFGGEPDPWTRVAESLCVPVTLGRDGLLDALDSAAQCSGHPLFLCLDAINETNPRNYWHSRFSEFASAVASRTHLKLCVSCRTSFLQSCLPKTSIDHAVEHKGFAGIERESCNSFFSHYDLTPPLIPVLQPELANPLYLKLVCETLCARGLRQLPKGWYGISPVIRAFLLFKEEQFATENCIPIGASIVSGSLRAISSEIAKTNCTALGWSEAQSVIDASKPLAKNTNILHWLVTADLLIEDGPANDAIGAENLVRPSFERFGDFLVASDMIENSSDLDTTEIIRNSRFSHLLNSAVAISENAGLLTALSILLPEKFPGLELTQFIDNENLRIEIACIVARAFPMRTAESFQKPTLKALELLLENDVYLALDSLLAISTQESVLDSNQLHKILESLPLAQRDGIWCGYLKQSYERKDIVYRIIEAVKGIELQRVDSSTAERWCIVLLWFTAAADRRIKDSATRAAVAILRYHSELIPGLATMFIALDDDAVRERILVISYGALINSRDRKSLKILAESLLTLYQDHPEDFQNAIIRDQIRCIGELANHLGCLDHRFDPTRPNHRNSKVLPPTISNVENDDAQNEVETGAQLVIHSCLNDDFNHYSIGCLHKWNHAISKSTIGNWIAQRVLNDFGYRNSGCSSYDSAVSRETGGGRSKPTWAERIGKKYQWIAMYQLASRIFDSIDPEVDPFLQKTERISFILNEERQLDPTISQPETADRKAEECWWVGGSVDLDSTKHLDFSTWVESRDDIPSMESLLSPIIRDGQNWQPLICFPSWSEYQVGRPYGEPYRTSWIHLEAFLVPEAKFQQSIKAITRRNFFGRWMPSSQQWNYVFAGEYPWASSCNTEMDDDHGFDSNIDGSTFEFIPIFREVSCEWEYDGTLPKSLRFHVPAPLFFENDQLWWNGLDGFSTPEGKVIFRDPSASEGGPATLLADIEELLPRLEKLGHRIVWTLLGEKQVLGEKASLAPQIIFSQSASMNRDGTILVGDRVFFPNYNQDQGLTK